VITLYQVGIPGLNVPGVFSVGPTFTLSTQVTADVRTNLETTIAIQENFAPLQFIFPPSSGKSSLVECHGTLRKGKRRCLTLSDARCDQPRSFR